MPTLSRACVLLAVPIVLAGLSSCASDGHFSIFGYTTRPNYDPAIVTVYVPIAQNISFRRGLEFDLTQLVIREINVKTPYRVVSDPSQADTELTMKVVNRRKNLILASPINDIRDQEVLLQVEVVWRDLRPGHVGDFLSNPKRFDPNELPLPGMDPEKGPKAIPVLITPVANYQPELGGSTTSAEYQALTRAATAITQLMEKSW